MSNTTDEPNDRAPETTTDGWQRNDTLKCAGELNDLRLMKESQRQQIARLQADLSMQMRIAASAIADQSEAVQARDRWYAAAGQRQDELNEAHQVIEWLTRAVLLEKDDLPAHLQAPEIVRKHVRIAKAQFKDALPPWPNFMEIEP